MPGARPDWLPKYYHQADSRGIGFDRSPSGSDAVEQYPEPLRSRLADVNTCPEEFLLWFHHVPWNHRMKSGRTLREELCTAYQRGVDRVASYKAIREAARPYLKANPEIVNTRDAASPETALYDEVAERLDTQLRDAEWWRDACLQYFARYSRMPLPANVPATGTGHSHALDSLMKIQLPISNYESPTPTLLNSVR